MIEVPRASGPVLVYRPWSDHDMNEAIEWLPASLGNGREFAAELKEICLTFHPTGA